VWRTYTSKGGFNSEEKGEVIDNGIDRTASTIKGVLNISLTSDVLGDRTGACTHDHCASSASESRRATQSCHTSRPEIGLFVPRFETRIVDGIVLDKSINIIINAERPSSVDLALCSDCPPRPQHPAAASLVFIFEQSVTLLPVCLTRQETAT